MASSNQRLQSTSDHFRMLSDDTEANRFARLGHMFSLNANIHSPLSEAVNLLSCQVRWSVMSDSCILFSVIKLYLMSLQPRCGCFYPEANLINMVMRCLCT